MMLIMKIPFRNNVQSEKIIYKKRRCKKDKINEVQARINNNFNSFFGTVD